MPRSSTALSIGAQGAIEANQLINKRAILCAFLLGASVQARAETGYVFEGDINGDGVADSIMSGPSELFENGGGPFVVSLSDGSGGFIRRLIDLHPLAVALDPVPGHPRLWQ